MGKYKKGVLGYFYGKVGTVCGAVWRGIRYMRSLPDITTDNPTEAQLNVRKKMELIGAFIKKLLLLIQTGYQAFNDGTSPYSAAMAYHLKNAVTGVAPNYTIDYPKVKFSVGELDRVLNPEMVAAASQVLNLTWEAGTMLEYGLPTDKVTISVYNPEKTRFVNLRGAATRADLEYELQLPADFSGDVIYCWMAYTSADGKTVSDAVYVGTTTVL